MCYGPTDRYINLLQVLKPLFSSYVYRKAHVISTESQRFLLNSSLYTYLAAAY